MSQMRLLAVLAALAALGAPALSGTADAATQLYTYAIEHPAYGRIGTYTDAVDESAGVTRIESELHVAVKVLGIVVYREDAQCNKLWHGDQLIWFRDVRTRNGRQSKVRGEALPDRFLVTSPSGTASAPVDVVPSDPWALKHTGNGMVVSTASGVIQKVAVSAGDPTVVSVQGKPIPVRHFSVDTPTMRGKWEIWLDGSGVPIKFRSEESGTPIDFVLTAPPRPATKVSADLSVTATTVAPGER